MATVANNAPWGCFVPVTTNAGGVVSNTATIAVAAPVATACSDPSKTPAHVHISRSDKIDNVNFGTSPEEEILDKIL